MSSDREVSVPFSPPASPRARRHVERAATSTLSRQLAASLEREAEAIAGRWESQARALLPDPALPPGDEAPDSPRRARVARAAALVRGLSSSLASDVESADGNDALGDALGTLAFDAGATLYELLRAFDSLVAMCLDLIEDGVLDVTGDAAAVDGVRIGRRLERSGASITLAAVRGYSRAADAALQERFRRLRHDLRNPIGTIRSALELMADESVPEEARRSPRFQAMIERNTAALDQLIVARLSDAEARVVPPRQRAGESPSAPFRLGESRDDLARPRERDDRQTGSL